MAEYIEREALMRRIKEIHCAECDSYHGVRCRACWVDDTLDYIDSEPAADVAPVRHGRWEDGRCSNCKEEAVSTSFDEPIYDYDWEENLRYSHTETHTEYHLTNYCPNCGCKMDLEG